MRLELRSLDIKVNKSKYEPMALTDDSILRVTEYTWFLLKNAEDDIIKFYGDVIDAILWLRYSLEDITNHVKDDYIEILAEQELQMILDGLKWKNAIEIQDSAKAVAKAYCNYSLEEEL